jgi:phosphoribosylanthranilate isomerase
MFRIKICGITTPSDAQMVAAAGVDAIGLNFYSKSPRYLLFERAEEIVASTPDGLLHVGLFVNCDAAEVCRVHDELRLGAIQLHGDETPEYLQQLGDRPVIKAFRVGAGGLAPVFRFLDRCHRLGRGPNLVLLDSLVGGTFGGSGLTGDWDSAAEYGAHPNLPPLVLAGGLNPENVEQAIQAVQPSAVDTASGVENAPGRKSAERVAAFVRAAKKAFGE